MLNVTELLARLVDEYQVTANYIVHGNCKSMEDYRAKCERLRTLEEVDTIAKGKDRKSESPADKDRVPNH